MLRLFIMKNNYWSLLLEIIIENYPYNLLFKVTTVPFAFYFFTDIYFKG